ncbi:Arm DNA-binding domain-containing protein, partial [Psychrobacter sp. AOP31-B2-9]
NYTYPQLEKRWKRHLDSCDIPYRALNNGRHTYASQVLSTGIISAEWLANQLGHVNTEMIHKHYGKFIPSDSRHIIRNLANALNNHHNQP